MLRWMTDQKEGIAVKVKEAREKWCCMPEMEKCFADECMAWRWFDQFKNDGYCGMAGKEGAEIGYHDFRFYKSGGEGV